MPLTAASNTEVHAPSAPITLIEALKRTPEHPEPRALRTQAQSYRAAADEVGLLVDNPTLSLNPGLRAQPASDRGFEFQATLSQPLRLAGVAASRRRSADAQAGQLQLAAIDVTHRRLEQTADLWLALWERRLTAELLMEQLQLADSFLKRAETAVAQGALTRADLAQARVFRGELAVERHQLTGEAHELGLQLALHLASPADTPLSAAGDPTPSSLPQLETILAHLEQVDRAPSVRLARGATVTAEAQLNNTEAESAPQASLGLSLAREAPNGLVGLLSASVQLPLVSRNPLGRAQAKAQLQRARADAELQRAAAIRQLVLLTHEVEHQRQAEAAVDSVLLPPLRDQAAASARLFELGEESVLELMRARQAVLAAERRRIHVRAQRHTAEQRLTLLLNALEWDKTHKPSTAQLP